MSNLISQGFNSNKIIAQGFLASGHVFSQSLTGTVTVTATLARSIGKILAATATLTAGLVKQIGKRLAATSVLSAVLAALSAIQHGVSVRVRGGVG